MKENTTNKTNTAIEKTKKDILEILAKIPEDALIIVDKDNGIVLIDTDTTR